MSRLRYNNDTISHLFPAPDQVPLGIYYSYFDQLDFVNIVLSTDKGPLIHYARINKHTEHVFRTVHQYIPAILPVESHITDVWDFWWRRQFLCRSLEGLEEMFLYVDYRPLAAASEQQFLQFPSSRLVIHLQVHVAVPREHGFNVHRVIRFRDNTSRMWQVAFLIYPRSTGFALQLT